MLSMFAWVPFRKIVTVSAVLFTLFSYVSLRVPPHTFWPAAFFSYSIPLVIGLNLMLLIIALVRKRLTAFLWFFLLLAGAPLLLRTLRLNQSDNPKQSLSILSFNTKLFRKPNVYDKFSADLINWAVNDTARIKCFQEYSTNANWTELDVTGKLKAAGYEGYTFAARISDRQHNPGLAIFTRLKILNTGVVWQDIESLNAAIFADLEYGGKIIRIYNVHFSSMKLHDRPPGWTNMILYWFEQLKNGSIKRSLQVTQLIDHLNTSPHPFIVCGDFNETPYSYVYSRMRRRLTNAFEDKGNGFGFTLNQKPYWLRIDHQFFSQEFTLQRYDVDKTMKLSDHFPTYGYYTLP